MVINVLTFILFLMVASLLWITHCQDARMDELETKLNRQKEEIRSLREIMRNNEEALTELKEEISIYEEGIAEDYLAMTPFTYYRGRDTINSEKISIKEVVELLLDHLDLKVERKDGVELEDKEE